MRAAAALAVAAAAALAAPGPAATVTRTEDQRLTHANPSEDAQAYLGTTLAMGEGVVGTRAIAGAPHGGDFDGGALHHFYWNGSWQWFAASSAEATGTPQAYPTDDDLDRVVVAVLRQNGSTSVGWNRPGGFEGLTVSYADEVEAIAYREPMLALGMPDGNGGSGLVVIYERGASGWEYVSDATGSGPGDRFGSALAFNGTVLVAGAPGFGDNGAAYLYVCCDSFDDWIEWQRLDSPATSQTGAEFGAAVEITRDGDWIAVGSPLVDRVITPGARVDVGAVYLYEHVGFGWELYTLLRPPGAGNGDHFGSSIAMHRKVLIGGSPGEDGAVGDEGAAYVYHLAAGEWEPVPRLRLVDSSAAESDSLGTSVAMGDLGALVGAPHSNGDGVFDSGAVLFYRDAGAFFADGFESGNTSAWSATTP